MKRFTLLKIVRGLYTVTIKNFELVSSMQIPWLRTLVSSPGNLSLVDADSHRYSMSYLCSPRATGPCEPFINEWIRSIISEFQY